MFQVVSQANETLSVPSTREEYDGIFRMRCVLEQGSLQELRLLTEPLDLVYIFAVVHRKGLGLRDENVLIINLQEGIAAGKLERWRGGEAIDQRPLSTLRSVEHDSATAGLDFKLQFSEGGSSLSLSARSASDAASICVLLRVLINTKDDSRVRADDSAMPPPPAISGWLTLKLAGQGHTFSRPFKAFALLGRSKLLVTTDRTCRVLRSLLTLESGSLQVSHTAGELEVELQMAKFKMVMLFDSAFVAGQWAQAISEGIISKGLFLDPSLPAADAGAPATTAPKHESFKGRTSPPAAVDPFEPVAPAAKPAAKPTRVRLGSRSQPDAAAASGSGGAAATAAPSLFEGDLLGDLDAAGDDEGATKVDAELQRDLDELLSQPTAKLDAATARPTHAPPASQPATAAAAAAVAAAAATSGPHCAPADPFPADMLDGLGGFGGLGGLGGTSTAGGMLGAAAPPPVGLGASFGADMLDMNTPPRGSSGGSFQTRPAGPGMGQYGSSAAPHAAAPAAPTVWSGADASLLDLMDAPVAVGAMPPPHAEPPPPSAPDAVGLTEDFMRELLGAAGSSGGGAEAALPASAGAGGGSSSAGAAVGIELRIEKGSGGGRLGLTLRSTDGVVEVLDVVAGSAAAAAGLTVGQRVLSVDGMTVTTSDQAGARLSAALARSAGPVPVRVRAAAVERLPAGCSSQAAATAAATTTTAATATSAAEASASCANGSSARVAGPAAGRGDAGTTPGSGLNMSGVAKRWGPSGFNAGGSSPFASQQQASPPPAPSPPANGDGPAPASGVETSGGRGAAEVEAEADEAAMSAPSMPFAEGSGVDSMSVAWQMPAWATGEVGCYELEWRRDGDESWHSSPASRSLQQQRATTSGLLAASAYWVRVRAIGRDGRDSPFSRSLIPALTAAEPPEAFPTDASVVSIVFAPVQCAARYELQWRQYTPPPGAPREWESSEASARIRGTTVNKKNLPAGMRFEFRVRAMADDGATSPFSAPSEWVLAGDPVRHFEERERERKAAAAAAAVATDVAATAAAAGGRLPNATAAPLPEEFLAQLQELGLNRHHAEEALRASGVRSVAAAADWYFTNHQSPPDAARPANDVDWLFR